MTGLPEPRPMMEIGEIDRRRFDEEIRPAGQPVIFRDLAAHWPAVHAARRSDEEFIAYLKRFRVEGPVTAIVGDPSIRGRFFYREDLTALNFTRGRSPLDPFLDRLLRDRDHPSPYAMAVQSEQIPQLLPGFEKENSILLLGPEVVPRAWIGNRIFVAPHYDLMENIGCVVAGRRRFTLFPPDQIANLYPGPLELTPAGTPVSMVELANPDLELYPRFAEAMENAQAAVLEPGDAIYIPFHWWHGVDSLEGVNLFVNYWWNDAAATGEASRSYDALMHAFYALRNLPPEQRAAWRTAFDYYVFQTNGDAAGHLPPHAKGVLGPPTPQLTERMRMTLKQILANL